MPNFHKYSTNYKKSDRPIHQMYSVEQYTTYRGYGFDEEFLLVLTIHVVFVCSRIVYTIGET